MAMAVAMPIRISTLESTTVTATAAKSRKNSTSSINKSRIVMDTGIGDRRASVNSNSNNGYHHPPLSPRTPMRRAKTPSNGLKPDTSIRPQTVWLAPGIDRAPREPGLDASQRAVMRRWRQTLAEQQMEVGDNLLQALMDAGLLTEDVVKLIKVERKNKARLYRMFDAIRASEQTTAFDSFCEVLATFHPDIAQNMAADVEVERGHVTIEPALLQEAETLVHRRFGGNKRFCELDKKDIAELFAWKLHVAHAEAKRERDRLLEALRAEKAKTASATKRCAVMADELDTFTAQHARRIVTHAHDMQTPADVIAVGDDSVSILQEKLHRMLERMDIVVTHDEKLAAERHNCLVFMKLVPSPSPVTKGNASGDGTDSIRLDTALSRYVASALGNLEAEIRDKDATIARLTQQLNNNNNNSGNGNNKTIVAK